MFGALRPSQPLFGGLLWKIPWRMSSPQKYRQRKRLQRVDRIVACLDNALKKQGIEVAAVERWKTEMPTEAEMPARDKYTLFDRKAKNYRKGVHKVPKWTRVSQRINPPGF
ncbi:mitochondrial ribosomal protein L31-domain-containing protein [Geopyxis carbonaria]|nr:mitochondrial ribosomal protein L31-domain-containing protein [Geopyxis carbonaria]